MIARRWAPLTALACALAIALSAAPASAAAAIVVRAGPWVVVRSTALWAAYADQGLTTVGDTLVTRGRDSVPRALASRGWTHIGDPGSWRGSVLDAYQSSHSARAKLFTLTTRGGTRYRFVHPLVRGEQPNNSFAAVAPHGRWFVAGEWGTMRRLLVFPLPRLRAAHRTSTLPLASTIRLTRPVRDVQGCAFDGPTHLMCSTDDPSADLFPTGRQLLDVTLSRPLDGRPVIGRPRYLGEVPATFPCGATPAAVGEVEGIDVARHLLRVLVNSPCSSESLLLTFGDSRALRSDPDPRTKWALTQAQSPFVLPRGERSAA